MTISSTPSTLNYLRDNVRDLLNEFDVADGLAAYYTLHHDPKRTALAMHRNSGGEIDGFIARCQTGFDLFRPLVTLRARGSGAIPLLLEESLQPGRPCLLVIPQPLLDRVAPYFDLTDLVYNHIYRFDPARFRPEINALVIPRADPYGNPRAEIRQGEAVIAAAGVNWRSPFFAEVYVRVEDQHQERGLGRAVLTRLVADLLKMEVTPLYHVGEKNITSQELAKRVGFIDSGAREVMAGAVRISNTIHVERDDG